MSTPQQLQSAVSSAPGITAAAQQALAAGCGVGSSLSQINSAIRQASESINSAISTANDIISAVQSLPGIITSQVSGVISTAITNALGPVRELNSVASQIQAQVSELLRLVNNPAAFLAQYLNIQNLFPNLNLNELLNQILSGLNICQATANASQQPANHPPSNQQAQPAPEPTPTPQPPEPASVPNLALASQITREELAPPPGVTAAPTPDAASQAVARAAQQEIIRLNVEEYRLRSLRFWSNDEQERTDLQNQINDVVTRRGNLSRSG